MIGAPLYKVGEVLRFGKGTYDVMEVEEIIGLTLGSGFTAYIGRDALAAPVCKWEEHCTPATADDMAIWARTRYCRGKRYGTRSTA